MHLRSCTLRLSRRLAARALTRCGPRPDSRRGGRSLYPGSEDEQPKAPTIGPEFMEYLNKIGVVNSTRHTLRDKEIFTVSQGEWVGVV